jgi:hypothetical protein
MQGFLNFFLILTFVGSVAFGWTHKPLWLLVPPVVIAAAGLRTSMYTAARMKESGLSTANFLPYYIFYKIVAPESGGRKLFVRTAFADKAAAQNELKKKLTSYSDHGWEAEQDQWWARDIGNQQYVFWIGSE